MLTELLNNVNSDIARGMAQAAGAIVLCLAVVGLCRQFAVHVERETAISIARGLVQMVFVGIVLAALLHGSLLVGAMILLAMTFAAAVTASRRARGIRGSLLLSFYAIAAGAGVVIAGMLATGTLTTDISVLVPVGSMIIANAMNACAQSVERFQGRRDGARGLYRGGVGAWRRSCSSDSALFPERGLRELTSPSRHAEISRFGLDTGRDGRNDGVGRQSRLRGNIPIRHRGNDPGRVGHYWIGRDAADENACFLDCRAIDNPSRH